MLATQRPKTCKVIHGLTTEAAGTIKDVTDPSLRDVALVAVGQLVEHHIGLRNTALLG